MERKVRRGGRISFIFPHTLKKKKKINDVRNDPNKENN